MKVAIIGAGNVGALCAQRIVEADLADVVLVDVIKGKAEGCALDLGSAASIMRHSRKILGTDEFRKIAGADIVILTCGLRRRPTQKREELLQANARIVKDVAEQIARYCEGAIVIVVTNPVDALTYLVQKTTGFAPHRVMGMAGTSDCARFNMLVAEELNIASEHVHSTIIGPHSDEMVILPRLSTVLGIPIPQLLPGDRIEQIIAQTKRFGTRIVQLLGKGNAYFGPSAGTLLLLEAIIHDQKNILCASVYLNGQYGLRDLYIGFPAKIGRMGVEEVIKLRLTEKEKKTFRAAANSVKNCLQKLGV